MQKEIRKRNIYKTKEEIKIKYIEHREESIVILIKDKIHQVHITFTH